MCRCRTCERNSAQRGHQSNWTRLRSQAGPGCACRPEGAATRRRCNGWRAWPAAQPRSSPVDCWRRQSRPDSGSSTRTPCLGQGRNQDGFKSPSTQSPSLLPARLFV
jgi:hypothetical protein